MPQMDYSTTQVVIGSAAAAVAGAFLLSKLWGGRNGRTARNPRGVSLDKQSVLVPGTTDVYCSPLKPDGSFTHTPDPSVHTLYDLFVHGMRASDGDHSKLLGTRPDAKAPYEWISYGETLRRAKCFASGLRHLGLEAGNDTRVGIYARNCTEWFCAALGCTSQAMAIVPLYDTLGADAAKHIVAQCDMQLVVVDTKHKAHTIIDNKKYTPTMQFIVVMEEIDTDLQNAANEARITVIGWDELQRTGAEHASPLSLPDKHDVYIICYTSGTTGTPKGVEITHANLVSNIAALKYGVDAFGMQHALCKESQVISYLPLSHMFEQLVHWALIAVGGSIGYFSGDVRTLNADIAELRPRVFPVVPRLLNRLYDKINQDLLKQNFVARTLFNVAYRCKLAKMRQGYVNGTVWDKLLFNKVQKGLGGNVQLMATGAAPVAKEVLEMCRVAIGAVIIEGYGQTECTALAVGTLPTETTGGHVGGPATCAHIKLVDVPELNYFSSDGKGEVCIRGPSVMRGYFKEPNKTRETIDDDGWLHTGDVGMWLPNGTLKIIDRKKHIFKLAQGEYVAPEKIENVYTRSPYIAQCFVEGNSLHRHLVAIVVPDPYLATWYENETGKRSEMEALCDEDKCTEFVMGELKRIGKENKLNSIEMVKAIKLVAEPFSIENGLLTPTQKAKRPQLRKYYAADIELLYEKSN